MIRTSKLSAEQQRESFFTALFSHSDKFIEIREIDKEKRLVSRQFLSYSEAISFVPSQDNNVYAGIFERRGRHSGSKKECLRTKALWADFDDMLYEEALYRIEMAKIPYPSMLINSGNGVHAYWILDKPAGHEVQEVLRSLSERIGADLKATDIPRILRVPGTKNVKSETLDCTFVQPDNGLRFDLRTFADRLKVNLSSVSKKPKEAIESLLKIKYNGLHNMASGVKKGERNFCTGRITQTLKRLGYSKQEVQEVLIQWNRLNSPEKPLPELKQEVQSFWTEQYQYAGQNFSDARLQEINERFIDSETEFFVVDEHECFHYDNELLGSVFPKVSGLTFAVLAIIKLSEDKGITLKEIAKICRRDTLDRTLRESISFLVKQKHVSKKERKGKATIYFFSEKPFSHKRGFTSVNKLLHKLFISEVDARAADKELNQFKKVREDRQAYNRLNELRYKLLILLENYAYNSKRECFPSDFTLAERMQVTPKTIKNNLRWLEANQYLLTEKREGKRYIKLLY
ncbi:helix-turn-helix domain-containing protein [Jeotgalibacillus terrae]|uniref:Helix-turn-helix domain-containing protein n=1 Tax=Jeotgalibacillus terrae TaxID=587735 RepID=A0ABW5ZLW8_9BACL|nr:helix-turn-helix domain-containing protein [Jeotgalibacillus terrae]MBM7581077.1 DNA-binding transcriptional MerR regulator [Jeotgalibacillus terrae]